MQLVAPEVRLWFVNNNNGDRQRNTYSYKTADLRAVSGIVFTILSSLSLEGCNRQLIGKMQFTETRWRCLLETKIMQDTVTLLRGGSDPSPWKEEGRQSETLPTAVPISTPSTLDNSLPTTS